MDTAGLDALLFLKFFEMCFMITGTNSIYSLLFVIPMCSNLDYGFFSFVDQSNNKSLPIIYLVGVYLYSISFFYLAYRYYSSGKKLRKDALVSSQASISVRTFVIYDMPFEIRSAALLEEFMGRIEKGQVEKIHLNKYSNSLSALVKKRWCILKKLEKELCKLLKTPYAIKHYDPNVLLKLLDTQPNACYDYIAPINKTYKKSRLSQYFSCFFKKDTIKYYAEKLKHYDDAIFKLRNEGNFTESKTVFITFKSVDSSVYYFICSISFTT